MTDRTGLEERVISRRTTRSLALLVLISVAVWTLRTPPTAARAAEERPRFPARVTTIDGVVLDVAALARRSTLVVVTLKAPACPVCQRQLERIKRQHDYLADCGVSFLVLAPGPAAELAAIRDRIGFAHPFVADEGLEIASSLGLRLSDAEMTPAILMLERDLGVGWMQRGRSGRFYGDGALIKQVECWTRIPI